MISTTLWVSARIRQTPFTSRVEAAGVRAYSVYNRTLLPVVFRSLVEDYRHLKDHVQLWDVSCQRQVEVRGPDAERLTQLMTPRDLSSAVPGQCLYAPLVDRDGGLINDPVVLKLTADRFWISTADADVGLWAAGLAHAGNFDVEVDEPEVATLAVQGPKAEQLMARVFGADVRAIRFFRFATLPFAGHPLTVARTGWSHQGGFEIYLDVPDLGAGLWDALWDAGQDLDVGAGCPNLIERIEAGLLSYGADITRENNPFECGFDRFCHLDRPIDVLGRAALERVAAHGPDRRIVGLRIAADALPACIEAWPVVVGARRVGQATSAAVSPDLGCGVAIAMLDRGQWEPGTPVAIRTPDGERPAIVSSLPFG